MSWTERTTALTPSDAGGSDYFGSGCALSSDGTVLAVGADSWDGPGGTNQGAVYVFDWDGSAWVERTTALYGSSTAGNDNFGHGCALSGDGAILAVGSPDEDSTLGTVRVFDWNGTSWAERAGVVTASSRSTFDNFGEACALSDDGSVLAVGVPGRGGGVVYVFDWTGSAWTERTAALAPSDAGSGDGFGSGCALSSDGTVLAVGADNWDGPSGSNQGAVYVFDWDGSAWVERPSVATSGDIGAARLGRSCALSDDGSLLAAGAYDWDGPAGNGQGLVLLFDWDGSSWVEQESSIIPSVPAAGDFFGYSCALSDNGAVLAVGAQRYGGGSTGAVYVFDGPAPPDPGGGGGGSEPTFPYNPRSVDLSGDVVGHHAGLPFTAEGLVAANSTDAVSYVFNGLPFTADGRLAVEEDGEITHIGHNGVGYTAESKLVIQSADPTRWLNGIGYSGDYPAPENWYPPVSGGGGGGEPSLRGTVGFVAVSLGVDDGRRPGLYPFDVTTTPPITIPDLIDVPVTTDYNVTTFSPTGQFLLSVTTAEDVEIHSFDGSVLSKVTDVTGRTFGDVYDVAWHPSGDYFSVCHQNSPYLSTFSWDGASATLLADADTPPESVNANATQQLASGLEYSPDGNFLAFGAGTTSPYVAFFNFSSGALTRVADPSTTPQWSCRKPAWSPTSRYCLVPVNTNGENFVIYDLDSGTPVKSMLIAATSQNGGATLASWSPDGRYLAVGYDSGAAVRVWDLDGGPAELTMPAEVGSNKLTGLAWTLESDRLFIATEDSPYLFGFEFDGAAVTYLGALTYATTAADGDMIAPLYTQRITI